MAHGSLASRLRFRRYRTDLRKRHEEASQSSKNGKAPAGPHTYGANAATSAFGAAGTDVKPPSRHRSATVLLKEFWSLLRGFHGRMYFALATVTVSTILALIPPYATKFVVDNILGNQPIPRLLKPYFPDDFSRKQMLWLVALSIMAFTVVSVFVGMTGRWQATKTAAQLKPLVRRKVFEHAMKLPLHRVYQLKTGGTASLLREDTGAIGDLIFGMLYNPWRAVVQLIGSLIVLAFVDWRLLMGSLVILPVVWFTHRMWIRRIRPLYRDMHNTRQAIDGMSTEAFGGIRVVRSFARQRSETSRFIKADQFRARQETHVWWWSRGIDIAWSFIIPAASATLLLYCGTQVLDGKLTIGDMFLFLTYLMMLLDPVAVLAQSATAFQTSLAGLDRVLDLLAEPTEMPSKPGAITLDRSKVQGRLTFRDVRFTYPGTDAPVLEGINIDVKPGEMIALVGPSGAGKTTFCNLVARFYDPTDGAVLLDGRDLRDIVANSYRSLLGIVEQDIFLFDGTIAENIGYARRGGGGGSGGAATLDQIMHYAKLANADEFIRKFADGYDTVIGERGVKLSGGQRQRLAIARALLADPRILILDEATSNLDTENERMIQESLRTLMAGRTSFVIAHRLSTIAHADRIVVIEKGRIVEMGTHEELMHRSGEAGGGGRYQQMVAVQTEPGMASQKRVPPGAAIRPAAVHST